MFKFLYFILNAILFSILSYEIYGKTPLYVMLPLDSVIQEDGTLKLKDENWLREKFQGLKHIGAKGIMSDCWWGLVENQGPKQYNFEPYKKMAKIAQDVGIKIQMVLSFHQCGTNIGDACYIPLPSWIASKDDIWYKSSSKSITKEYISLWADNEPLDSLKRTPLKMYQDFMQEFKTQLVDAFPNVIVEIQIGAGPSGELRYPAYQLQDNRWSFCGVGEFQSYDKYALASVAKAARKEGRQEFGTDGGPNNAGNYNCYPSNDHQGCSFFSSNGFDNYKSDYGRFFLGWYSKSLIEHGEALGRIGREVYGNQMDLSIKVAGVHWWYNTYHHGGELTAGYYNTNNNNAYAMIANSFKKSNLIFCFTCLEMSEYGDRPDCASRPQKLVGQTIDAVRNVFHSTNTNYAGENALPVGDYDSLNRIIKNARGTKSFTWLRLSDSTNWDHLKYLVSKL